MATMSSANSRCAVVTGANKGIELEICPQLASHGVSVILTARDENRGMEAARQLQASGLWNVVFHQLDVIDPDSIASLAKFIQTNYGKLDILINNAGVGGIFADRKALGAFKLKGGALTDENANLLKGIIEQTDEMTENCIKANYYGTKGVTEGLLPLLQLSQSARIVNISSFYGQLKVITNVKDSFSIKGKTAFSQNLLPFSVIKNEKVKAELENVECLTADKLDKILQSFLRDFKEGKLEENGWPLTISAYKVSKAAIYAYTRLAATKFPSFRVNCVHPGLVKTDMTNHNGNLTPEEGARAPVMLALLPDIGPSGLYFDQMNVSSF